MDERALAKERAKRLAKELRQETAGRKRFATFAREEFFDADEMFVNAGYYAIVDIRLTQENTRQCFITDLRKSNQNRETSKGLRLIVDIFQLFEIQKGDDRPKYEEITTPERMKKWRHALANLRGLLLPDQDACNFFSFELAKGHCEEPPIAPFVIGGMALKPWAPSEPSHLRALEGWIVLQKPRKRPSTHAISFQSWITYSMRFILVGDLTSAWKTFGGISAQLTHIGAVLNIATLENVTIAMTYDAKIRFRANDLSKFRERGSDIIALLMQEDQAIKRETLRGCGFTQTFAHIPSQKEKGRGGKGDQKGNKKVKKGQNKGGEGGKRQKGKRNDKWKQNDWSNSWSYGERNDWTQPSNDWSEGSAHDSSKPSDDKPFAEPKQGVKKK